MHITVQKETLQNRLELVGKVSTKHVTLPVLQCVLVKTGNDTVSLSATNLEIGIEATIDADVQEAGVVAVPAQTLLQTIQFIKEKEVQLRVEETVLVIESKQSTTNIKTVPYEEFPKIPTLDTKGVGVDRTLFAVGVRTAACAASQSSIKPELGSVYILQKKEHTLTFVATDSFRLMEKTVSQKGVTLEDPILIPYKNALELARVCDLEEVDPELRVSENQCALQFPNGVYITSRLISGSFPDYQQIIPKEYSTHTTLLKTDLAQALKKTNIFLNKFFQISMHLTERSCTISANSGEVGTTTESVMATTEGEELSLSFNHRYIVEPLGFINDESVVMHFAGIGRPMVMEGVHDRSLRYLVMPMNK